MNLLGHLSGVTTDGVDSQVKATVLDLTNSNPVAVRLVDNTGAGVDITGGGDGAIVDGVSAAIRATVFSRTNSKALAVELVDTNGDPLSGSAVSIVDGGDVTEGAKADAAVLDATGTVNAHLRGVVKILADVWDSVNHRVHVAIDSSVAIAIAAGSAVIGHVITDTGSTTAVTGNVTTVQSTAASLNMTEASAASSLTSLQLIDDIVYTDDTSTHATGTSKGALIMAAATPTDTSVNANDIGAVAMTTDRKLHVSVQDALPAGSNVIGHVITDTGSTTVVTGTVTVGSHAVTNAGTFAVQESGTQIQADDAAFTPATSKVAMVGATFDDVAPDSIDEGDGGAIRMSANRNLYVRIRDNAGNERGLNVDANGAIAATVTNATAANLNVTEASAASSLTSLQLIDDIVYTDDTSTHATGTSKGALMMAAATPTDTSVNANDIGAVAMTTDRKLHVSVQDALPAGTNGIGKLTANSGVTIGAVEIAAAQTLATVTTVSTVTALTGGGVAHDGVDSGNPVKIGFEALNALPTAVSSADRANGISDLWGRQLVSHIDPAMQINKTVNYTSTQTGATVWTPTSGKKIAITSVVIGSYGTTAARLILWFGDSGDTTYSAGTDQAIVLASFAPSATVTPGLVFSPAVPIFCTTANREVHITTSAGMSVDVVIYGYEW